MKNSSYNVKYFMPYSPLLHETKHHSNTLPQISLRVPRYYMLGEMVLVKTDGYFCIKISGRKQHKMGPHKKGCESFHSIYER